MAEITFYAAECMEFPEQMGELHENLTLPEAVDVYMWICRGTGPMGRGLALCCRMETSRIIPAPNGRYIRAGGLHRI